MEKVPIHSIGLRIEPIWRWTSTFPEADENVSHAQQLFLPHFNNHHRTSLLPSNMWQVSETQVESCSCSYTISQISSLHPLSQLSVTSTARPMLRTQLAVCGMSAILCSLPKHEHDTSRFIHDQSTSCDAWWHQSHHATSNYPPSTPS